ncbi:MULTISPECIES: FAD-binding oxidoreductase [Bradyrhizobium]|uniref:FAD-binding oxidoreductase n=1 Tax=Bradyrhizobium TaxID=374 RepID=UPI00155F205D|nr:MULTISPECIES: FAD-binding oxidoreductase [Bradyrhizobium]MDD1516959.1 oxidoreductase [Bradyrhizobium sp. WBAH30]MDD1543218.1 oxidoreductase [Bradyrhizobium sp. WBAH41]MDD1554861.1 oxidoreductase [Bradyrhizobium sp. WBAH23]MDD1562812.1 oxidoreductase [Bradyrhizobium sp. WBAH33]MDD1590913.1 oxidoreductase [Bradyrhizobium sp. WBAH42]
MSGPILRCRFGLLALGILASQLAAMAAPASDVGRGVTAAAERFAQPWKVADAEGDHAAHHPAGAGGEARPEPEGSAGPSDGYAAGGSPAASSAGMMGGMDGMMGRPRKAFYPALMEMPALSAEQRSSLESEAHARIGAETDRLADAETNLRHAIAGGDIAAADQASRRLRESLNAVQSGVVALRSLHEGKPLQQIAQAWFKSQMNLPSARSTVDADDGATGISWFHVTTMALLALFSVGMLAVYIARMRRANALVDRLTRVAVAPAAVTPIITTVTTPAASPLNDIGGTTTSGDTDRRPPRGAASSPWKGKLRVCAIYRETPDVKTFRLQAAEGGTIPFAFLPGQFLTYAIEVDGQTVRRSYTIASSAAQTAYVETTIKRQEGGLLSDYMHGQLKEGDLVEVTGPSGAFTFTGTEADSVVLIGGGVGITPLMAAIRYLSDIAWPGQIYLIYGAQTTEQFIFRDELEYLQRRMDNLHVAATMMRASGTSWMGREGQITAEFLIQAVPDLAKRRVHLCGPPGMMDALRKTLIGLGVPGEQIKTEAFGPARGAVPPAGKAASEAQMAEGEAGNRGAAAVGPATATIRFAKSGKMAALPPDKSVLEVAESAGVAIDYSCRAGVCGVCKTHLLQGNVTMEVQDALTAEDKANGLILACQARSVGDLVVEV